MQFKRHILQTDAADGNVDWKNQAKGVFNDIKVGSIQAVSNCFLPVPVFKEWQPQLMLTVLLLTYCSIHTSR